MRSRSLKHVLALSCGLLVAASAAYAAGGVSQINVEAKRGPFADADHAIYTPIKGGTWNPGMNKANITNHGGPTITSAKVVMIFWGPSFATGGADHTYATTLQAFRNQLGTTGEYNTITQYSSIQLANLGSGSADWFDSSNPPTNVTDSQVQAEVGRYLQTHTFNSSTIYSVFIPRTSYSSSGSSTSCGGPGLAYCAYHSWTGSSSSARKYSIEPYPSCGGCQVAGWSDVQDAEHFFVHEIREAVTDPNGSAWFDSSGNEADDKCAWSPTPFIGTGGYGYQYEWSNANGGCIRTR